MTEYEVSLRNCLGDSKSAGSPLWLRSQYRDIVEVRVAFRITQCRTQLCSPLAACVGLDKPPDLLSLSPVSPLKTGISLLPLPSIQTIPVLESSAQASLPIWRAFPPSCCRTPAFEHPRRCLCVSHVCLFPCNILQPKTFDGCLYSDQPRRCGMCMEPCPLHRALNQPAPRCGVCTLES